MTAHLDRVELVDAVDGLLAASRAAHLENCSACRERVRSLSDAMIRLRPAADVPEPSPLFWDHLSRRVHEAVRESHPGSRAGRWSWAAGLATVTGVGLLIFVVTTTEWQQTRDGGAPQAPAIEVASAPPAIAEQSQSPALDVESDADWALVRAVADDLHWEDTSAAGIHARPGSADRVAADMSPAERQELAQLIEVELKRTGA